MLIKAVEDLCAELKMKREVDDLEILAELCPPNMTGDVTVNCFRLAKPLKGNPMQLAAEAVEFLTTHPDVEAAEAVKAFVNITLTPAALFRDTVADSSVMATAAELPEGERKKYLIEFSAPNTNKPLHLGHLRNNSLGMALVEILRKVGHEVVPVNLVNDRGVHICKSMEAYRRFGNGVTPESAGKKGDHLVGDFYVRYAEELSRQVEELKASDPSLREKSEEELFLQTEIGRTTHRMLQRWEEGDPEVCALWEKMNGWVLGGFGETYRRMGVRFEKTYFESETYMLGRDIIKQGLERGIFYTRADGAVEIDLSDKKLEKKVVLRSDGTSVYITQDFGTTLLKANDFEPDAMIWVVGDEQIYHFRVLFEICRKFGYPWADDLHHLAYGMVSLPSGKMKSREGTVVDADNLFDEMHELAKKEILERVGEDVPEDLEVRAEEIGIGAVKFMLLKNNPKTSMKFDPEAAVQFEGDTAALVQYAYARICSILRKAAELDRLEEDAEKIDWSLLAHPKEKELALKCAQYGGVMQGAAEGLDTGRVCNYLLELARGFNSFYHECPVIKVGVDAALRSARLALIERVQVLLKEGLEALTIGVLEEM
jgi:arginyl-tRNA synthetase